MFTWPVSSGLRGPLLVDTSVYSRAVHAVSLGCDAVGYDA